MNSAFVGYEELSRSRRVLSTEAEDKLNIDAGSVPLGLSSSANILQIADVALRVVFLLFLLF